MDQITIALIGATGRTGSEFLKLALEEGYCIKALVRTPSKVTIRNSRLQLIHGDLDDVGALEKLADGATYVVCMAAATMVDGVYPNEYMLHFVQRLYPILQKSQPQVFLYQAGSMSADGKGFLHPVAWAMKQTIGRKLKIFDKINDNDAVIRFMGETESNFNFIVTRAGVLKEGPNEKEAVTSNWVSLTVFAITKPDFLRVAIALLMRYSRKRVFTHVRVYRKFPPLPWFPITFADLAACSLRALRDKSVYNSYPFVC